jgi:hypothetical protein
MSVGNALVLGFSIIILVCFVAFVIEMYIPLFIKLDTYQIIKPYMFIIEEKGNLTSYQEDDLIDAIRKRGLTNVEIDIEYEGQGFGDLVHIEISALYQHNPLVDLFSRVEESLNIRYEKTVLIRKIKN